MYENILIATDFSNYADKILSCVGQIPGVKEAVLLHVLSKDPLARVWSPGDEKKQAETLLKARAKDLQDAGLCVSTRVELAEETPVHRIVGRVAEEERASLVVMGARGKSIWEGLLLGSVSSGYLRYGERDMLIMRYRSISGREGQELSGFCSRMFENVLTPTDFSDAGNAAIKRIMESRLAQKVVLLNVASGGEDQASVDQALENSRAKLEVMRSELERSGVQAKSVAVSALPAEPRTYGTGGMAKVQVTPYASIGGVVERIITISEIENASLIALGSRGKGWLDEAGIGSVASDVARMGPRPVLIVRSKK